MQNIKLNSLIVLTAFCDIAAQPNLAGTRFVSNSMGFANGVTAKAIVAVEPSGPLRVFDGQSFSISTTDGIVYHRAIQDDSKQVYFGYDLSTERIPNSDQIRVTFAPLSLSAGQLDVHAVIAKDLAYFRFLVLPRYPPPQVVRNGDTIALDLLVSADGKQKIVDYIEISYKPATNSKR